MKVLLFDMDHVLLNPGGYRRALRYAVDAASRALGYRPPGLSDDEIDEIEAAGVTSEWEIAAICSALMMDASWQQGRRDELPEVLPPAADDPSLPKPPEFLEFFRRLAELDLQQSALDRAGILLMDGQPDRRQGRTDPILELLALARTPQTVTFRTIQELVLGSKAYADTYGLPAAQSVGSYLHQYDQSNLAPEVVAELRAWLERPGQAAVIFTNRPNRPPAGHQDTPEAELGAELVGLGDLPLVGSGDMGWLSQRLRQRAYAFLKPSPVHALAAIQAALGRPKVPAILEAHNVAAGTGRLDGVWAQLDGAEVLVFEDSRRGMDSAVLAQERLAALGVDLELTLAGVANSRVKADELARVGATVYRSIGEALQAQVFT